MKNSVHPRYHWVTVAVVSAAAMLTLTEASGQSTGAGAIFEGRPAMAGAQGGLGAQAGMPQGGLGVQGNEGQKGLVLRKPSGLDSMPPVPTADTTTMGAAPNAIPVAEQGLAREQRSGLARAEKAAKKTAKTARTGVTTIDAK